MKSDGVVDIRMCKGVNIGSGAGSNIRILDEVFTIIFNGTGTKIVISRGKSAKKVEQLENGRLNVLPILSFVSFTIKDFSVM